MRKHRSIRIGFGLLALLFSVLVTQVSAQTAPAAPVPLPSPFNPVVDYANVIDADTRARLESIFLNLKERGKIEYAVLTVRTTGDRDIFDFGLAVARGWGIGSKEGDRAALLLIVAIDDRKYFTQVSRHLEGDLPDGLVGQIQRKRLVPAFREGQYSKGIYDTVQAYVATLAANRGFSVDGIDQRYAERIQIEKRPDEKTLSSVCVGIIIVGFILFVLFSSSRRSGRGGGSGCLQALFWGTLFSNFNSGRGHSSGWGGGGFGGGGFGGGGGGGGFGGGFGGGGDFGGGGAGGDW